MAEPADYPPRQSPVARRAKKDRFRMSYGVPGFLAGWFVTYLVCCVGLTITNGISEMMSPGAGEFGVGFLVLALIFGFPIAVIVGLPLAALVAWPLRRVRDQRLHVLAFAVALGAVMAGYVLLTGDGQMEAMALPWILGAAACGAIGRASVIKLVARRNHPDPELAGPGLSRTRYSRGTHTEPTEPTVPADTADTADTAEPH